MKNLITVPHLNLPGGVANYYSAVSKHFSTNVEFFELGALRNKENVFVKARHLFGDWIRFRNILKNNADNYHLIHINPSFAFAALLREAFLIKIAKKSNLKILITFHGWNENFVKLVEKYFFHLFFSAFNMADAFIVLSSDIQKKMRDWGFTQPIYLETTAIDDDLVDNFIIEDRISNTKRRKNKNILFLSRIEKEKGICETIEAFSKLSSLYPWLHLIIAGDGTYLNEAINFSNKMKLENKVSFLGHVKGQNKKNVFIDSDIYIFPSYSEGMPTSVLEAMAFGLPVVTRSVGGLKDIFVNGSHGYMTESKDPCVFASLIEKIILDNNLCQEMSMAAHKTAIERFLASNVAKRIESVYKSMMCSI